MAVRCTVVIGIVLLLLLFLAPTADGQLPCPPDQISARASGDTIFVSHRSAERNCCATLVLRLESDGFVADFYEGEAEPYCRCLCCFNLTYDAYGFAAGSWLVRVWDDAGTVLYGQTDVFVPGEGQQIAIGNTNRGDCVQVATVPSTWTVLRRLYH
jgi:hypothetical protein